MNQFSYNTFFSRAFGSDKKAVESKGARTRKESERQREKKNGAPPWLHFRVWRTARKWELFCCIFSRSHGKLMVRSSSPVLLGPITVTSLDSFLQNAYFSSLKETNSPIWLVIPENMWDPTWQPASGLLRRTFGFDDKGLRSPLTFNTEWCQMTYRSLVIWPIQYLEPLNLSQELTEPEPVIGQQSSKAVDVRVFGRSGDLEGQRGTLEEDHARKQGHWRRHQHLENDRWGIGLFFRNRHQFEKKVFVATTCGSKIFCILFVFCV